MVKQIIPLLVVVGRKVAAVMDYNDMMRWEILRFLKLRGR